MTLTPLGALRLLVQEEYQQVPVRDWPLVALLPKLDAYQTEIKWNVNVGGATATGRATDAATAIGATTDVTVPATLGIGSRVLGHRFNVIRNNVAQARVAGVGALRNLFAQHIRNAFDVIMDSLNGALYTGDGTANSHGIFGLNHVSSPTLAYAGILPATHPTWVSNVAANAGTGRNLTRALLGDWRANAANVGNNPSLYIMSPMLGERYSQLFANEPSTSVMVDPRGNIDLGFGVKTYNGVPIVEDRQCPAGRIFALRRSMTYLHTFNLSGTDGSPTAGGVDASKVGGLNFLVAELRSENPHIMSFEISLQPQLQVSNRRKDLAVLADINQ